MGIRVDLNRSGRDDLCVCLGYSTWRRIANTYPCPELEELQDRPDGAVGEAAARRVLAALRRAAVRDDEYHVKLVRFFEAASCNYGYNWG